MDLWLLSKGGVKLQKCQLWIEWPLTVSETQNHVSIRTRESGRDVRCSGSTTGAVTTTTATSTTIKEREGSTTSTTTLPVAITVVAEERKISLLPLLLAVGELLGMKLAKTFWCFVEVIDAMVYCSLIPIYNEQPFWILVEWAVSVRHGRAIFFVQWVVC